MKHAVVVADAIADNGQRERRAAVEKTGGESAETAIAETSILLTVIHVFEVKAEPAKRVGRFVLDAEIEVYAEPKFRFDITGFAEITADLFITEITLYEKRWELAAIEVGSDYRVGIKLPYHQEGDEFAGVDWSAVEFELPDVDPQEILSSLVDRIA